MTATIRTTGTDDGSAALAIVLAPEPDRRERPSRGRPGRHLRPVEKPTKTRKKRSPAVPVMVGAGIVISGLFALAVMHALLIGGQLRLDDLRREQASGSEEVRRLRLQVAELEAPDRVLEVARDRLGMVDPGEIGYLLPVGVAGGDDAPVRVEAAQPPPPPPAPVDDGARSPEEREVEAALTGPPLTDAEVEAADTTTADDAASEDPATEDPATEDPATAPTAPSEGERE